MGLSSIDGNETLTEQKVCSFQNYYILCVMPLVRKADFPFHARFTVQD